MTPNTPVAATDDAVAWDETDLSILRSYRRVLEAWSKDETVPPVLRDDLTRFMSWFGPLQEAATTVTSLRAEIERLTAALAKVGEQRDELELLARLLTKGLTGLTPNGSEYFTRVGENYYADTAKCVAFVRQRHETIHDQLVKAVTKKNTTEAQLLQKSQQLETAQSEIERLTRERDEARAATREALTARAEMEQNAFSWKARVHELEEGLAEPTDEEIQRAVNALQLGLLAEVEWSVNLGAILRLFMDRRRARSILGPSQ